MLSDFKEMCHVDQKRQSSSFHTMHNFLFPPPPPPPQFFFNPSSFPSSILLFSLFLLNIIILLLLLLFISIVSLHLHHRHHISIIFLPDRLFEFGLLGPNKTKEMWWRWLWRRETMEMRRTRRRPGE